MIESQLDNVRNIVVIGVIVVIGGNQIKFLNSEAFEPLTKLTYVDLEGNECINVFFGSSKISTLKETLQEKCGFDETAEKIAKVKELGSSLKHSTKTIARLEAELKSSKS